MKLGIAVLLVFLLIDAVNWHEVWQSMVQMQGRYVVLFCFFYIGGIVISAWKWSIIARHIGFEHSHFFYVKTYLAGTFLNNFFPSFIGGDAYRTITIGKKSRRMIDATTTVIMDRMTGLVFLLLYAITFAVMAQIADAATFSLYDSVWYIVIFIITVVCVGVVFARFSRTVFFKKHMPTFVHETVRSFARYSEPRIVSTLFLLSTAFIMCGIIIANYMLFLACDMPVTFTQYIGVILIANVIAAVPISVGNIGTKEWAYILLFGMFGVSSSILVAIVLVSRVVQMCISLIAIPFFFRKKNQVT